jgi:CO/xanthine dehydrogenase FAD-binding subunit
VIPAAFDYVAPSTVDDAVRALTEAGEDAKVIAGGQSLLSVLRRPSWSTSARSPSCEGSARTATRSSSAP